MFELDLNDMSSEGWQYAGQLCNNGMNAAYVVFKKPKKPAEHGAEAKELTVTKAAKANRLHLKKILDIVEKNMVDCDKAVKDVKDYIAKHRSDIDSSVKFVKSTSEVDKKRYFKVLSEGSSDKMIDILMSFSAACEEQSKELTDSFNVFSVEDKKPE
jgi:hypothetical protein